VFKEGIYVIYVLVVNTTPMVLSPMAKRGALKIKSNYFSCRKTRKQHNETNQKSFEK